MGKLGFITFRIRDRKTAPETPLFLRGSGCYDSSLGPPPMPGLRFRLHLFLAPFLALLVCSVAILGQDAPHAFEDLSRQAEAARVGGNTSEAIGYYERALKVRPEWPEGWWYLGTLYADAGRFDNAIPVFRELTGANPKLGPAWASLGLSEFELKDYQNALLHLQKAQELGFKEAPNLENVTNYHLALLLNRNGEFEDAFGLLASQFGSDALAEQTRVALAMSLLRIPLLPEQLDPGKDALIADAGETAQLLVTANFDQAFLAFQKMLRDYPNTPFLHYAYGSALDFNSRFEEAEAQLLAETHITPHSSSSYMRLAAIALKSHRPGDAEPLAKHAIELSPRSATAHKILAKALAELGQAASSAQEAAAAEKLEPEKPDVDPNVAAFYANEVTPIENFSSKAKTNAAATDNFDELNTKAVAAGKGGRTEEAISFYRDALRLRSEWDEGWSQLGTLLYIAGRPVESISALKNSLRIKPQRADAWVFLGLCEFETKEYRNSFLHLERGRELGFHGTAEAQRIASLRLAALRVWSGDFDGAKDLLIPEVDRNHLAPDTKAMLGLMLLRIPLLTDRIEPSREALVRAGGETAALLYAERYNEAFQSFERMLKDFPGTPFVHYAYGSALESLSQHEQAEAQLLEEIKVAPSNALAYARIADIFLRTGNPENALSNAQHAEQLDPAAPGAHELLGRALLEVGKTDAAVKELELASRLAPTYPEVHFHLARAYAKARMTSEAERERSVFARLNAAQEAEKGSQSNDQTFFAPYEQRSPSSSGAKAPSSTARQ